MVFITQISLTYAICSTEFLKFNGGLTNQVMAHKHVLAIKGCTVNVQQDPRILILGRLAPHSPLTKVTTVRSCITLRFTSYNGPPAFPLGNEPIRSCMPYLRLSRCSKILPTHA